MTGHVAQSSQASIEAEQLMAVQQNIINGKNGRAHIMPRQNHLLGLHLMTVTERFLERDEFMTLLVEALPGDAFPVHLPIPAILRPRALWTARQAISLLFPETLTLAEGQLDTSKTKRLNRVVDAEKTPPPALIVRGQFIYGVMNNALSNSIVLAIYTSAAVTNVAGEDVRGLVPEQCSRATRTYINSVARMIEKWLEQHSSSMGLEDMMTDVVLRGAPLVNCDACVDDPKRVDVLRSCPLCRLHCAHCKTIRVRMARETRQFVFDQHACGKCCASTTKLLCSAHGRSTMLPRCRPCFELHRHGAHFSLTSVPRDVKNTTKWPFDVAYWRHIGPIKFTAWCRLRESSDHFARTMQTQQKSWTDAVWPVRTCEPTMTDIDGLEALLVSRFAEQFASDVELRVALPAHADEHALCLSRWQRIGPTKYAIERRLARVEPDVRRAIDMKRRAHLRDFVKGKMLSVDARLDEVEFTVNKIVDIAKKESHDIAWSNLPPDADLRRIIEAGTKGNKTNVGNIVACVGQQQIDGARIVDRMFGIDDGVEGATSRALADSNLRYLPHMPKMYPGGMAGGFGARSLMDGADPLQFWMQAVAGRDSIVNTAVKTAPVGYLSRRVGKNVEGVISAADGTVRNSDGSIVQTRYGAGYSTQFLTTKKLQPLTMTDAQLRECVLLNADADYCVFNQVTCEPCDTRRGLVVREREMLLEALAYMRDLSGNGEMDSVRTVNNANLLLLESIYSGTGAFTSTAVAALLPYDRCASPSWNSRGARDEAMLKWRASIDAKQRTEFRADGEEAETRALYDDSVRLLDECDVIVIVGTWLTRREDCRHERCREEHRHLEHCDDVTRCELRLRLCAKQVVRRFCMNRQTLGYFMDAYAGWLRRATVVAGEAVGIQADQSWASETMQSTLSSFHFAGTTSVAVNEGMPRALETTSSRSTAKMATPKVTAYLPQDGGYRLLRMDELTRTLVRNVCSMNEKIDFDRAWLRLGRADYKAKLRALFLQVPQTKLPTPQSVVGQRKRAAAQRDAEDQEALNEAKFARRDELGAMVTQMLDICRASHARHHTDTLDTLFENWRVIGNPPVLRADVVATSSTTVTAASSTYATLVCRHAIWYAVLPLLGTERALGVVPIYDDATERWLGVEFRYQLPAAARAQAPAVECELHLQRIKSAKQEAERFYKLLCDERANVHVFCPDAAHIELLELLKEDEYAQTLELLELPQQRMSKRAHASEEASDDVEQYARRTINDALVFTHTTHLRRPALTDMIEDVEIIYAPLQHDAAAAAAAAAAALDDDDDALPYLPATHKVGDVATALFDENIVATYRYQIDDKAFGCQVCCTGADGRRRGASQRERIVTTHAHCQPALRCLSSFVLQLHISQTWINLTKSVYFEQIESTLRDALGDDHSILVTERNETTPVVHIRLHTCALDRLARRTEPGGNLDFARALLDDKVLRENIVIGDDPNGDEPAPRARRSKTIKEDAAFERHLRRHVQRALRGELTKLTRADTWRTKNDVGDPAHRYTREQANCVLERVNRRLAIKCRPTVTRTLNGDEFTDYGVIKYQRAKCGEPPTKSAYVDTQLPLIEYTAATDVQCATFGVVEQKNEIDPSDGLPILMRVTKTLANLIDDERAQLTTQIEVGELQRTLQIVMQLRLGTVDAEAHTICCEEIPKMTMSPNGGVMRRVERAVALDSRNYLRVMNERIVDRARSTTNAIMDVQQVLGKMAARNKTCSELNAIMSASGSFVDRAHLALLANVQWCKGWCMPFTVHGLKQVSDDVLQQMSFETTATMLRDAVVRRAVNEIISPSTCVSMGVAVRRLGTSSIDLLFDPAYKLPSTAHIPLSAEQYNVTEVFAREIAAAASASGNASSRGNLFTRLPHLGRAMDRLRTHQNPMLNLLRHAQHPNVEPSSPTTNFVHDDDFELDDIEPSYAPPQDRLLANDHLFSTIDQHGSMLSRSGSASVPAYDPEQPAMRTQAPIPLVMAYDPEQPAYNAVGAVLPVITESLPSLLDSLALLQQNAMADELSFMNT